MQRFVSYVPGNVGPKRAYTATKVAAMVGPLSDVPVNGDDCQLKQSYSPVTVTFSLRIILGK
jgi:hypothetical protein